MRPIPQCALDLIDGSEGDKLRAYRDGTGRLTIGRGHTGPEVVAGMEISEGQSQAYRFSDAVKAGAKIAKSVSATRLAQLSDHQYGALVDFGFNLGFGTDVCPTLIRMLNAGQFDAVPAELLLFDHQHVNGRPEVVPGLYHRRAAEGALWKTADVASAIAIVQSAPVEAPPSSYTREVDTPPAPVFAKPLMASKRFLSACALGVVGSCKAALGDPQSVQDTVKTWADNLGASPLLAHSTVLQHANAMLTGLVLILGFTVPTLIILKKARIVT